LQGSADAVAVLEQLPHLGQEDAAQRHQLLNLLPAQVQGILQNKHNKIDCVCNRLKFSVCQKQKTPVKSIGSAAELMSGHP